MGQFTAGGQVQGNRAPAGNNGEATAQSQKPQGFAVPFTRAAKTHTEPFQTQTGTLSTSQQTIILRVPVYGYLKRIWLQFVAVSAANAAAVTFNADGPWNALRQVMLRDANGTPIHNLTGYYSYLAAKFGGYTLFRPEGSTLAFSTTTGAVGAGGSFTFNLPINLQFGRDGLGALPNMDASTQYQIELTVDTLANIYGVLPTNPPTFTIQGYVECYQNPPASDQFGNTNRTQPPAVGTAGFWSYSNFPIGSTSENTVLLNRVGNLIRNHILVFRTGAGVRSATVQPASGNVIWEWDAYNMFADNTLFRQALTYDTYGFDLETGVSLYGRTSDPDGVPVGEYGDQYLPTLGTTKLLLRFTPGATGSIDVITNDIVPVGNIYATE